MRNRYDLITQVFLLKLMTFYCIIQLSEFSIVFFGFSPDVALGDIELPYQQKRLSSYAPGVSRVLLFVYVVHPRAWKETREPFLAQEGSGCNLWYHASRIFHVSTAHALQSAAFEPITANVNMLSIDMFNILQLQLGDGHVELQALYEASGCWQGRPQDPAS